MANRVLAAQARAATGLDAARFQRLFFGDTLFLGVFADVFDRFHWAPPTSSKPRRVGKMAVVFILDGGAERQPEQSPTN